MEEIARREDRPIGESETAPIYVGGDGAGTADLRTGEVEVLDGEVVESGDPRGSDEAGGELVLAEPLPRDLHPLLVYLASLSEGSRRTMRASLENIARFISGGEADAMTLAWHELRYQHTTFIRSTLAEAYKPATSNKMMSALRGVLKECFRLGYMTAEDYQRARDLSTVKNYSLPPGRSISQGELRRLVEVCAESNKKNRGARDAAVVALLYGCGLRRSEAVALDLSDYDAEAKEVRVRGAKGKKDRMSYAVGGAQDAIEAWVEVCGDEEGPLLYPINKGDNIQLRRMSDQAIYDILRRLGREIKTKSFAPHDMRRTFIGDLLHAGADLFSAQQLAGHANVQTTARYDRRGEEEGGIPLARSLRGARVETKPGSHQKIPPNSSRGRTDLERRIWLLVHTCTLARFNVQKDVPANASFEKVALASDRTSGRGQGDRLTVAPFLGLFRVA